MRKLLVAAIVALCLPSVQAADMTLLSGFASKHTESGYCEWNPGVGVRLDSGEWSGWAAGVYRNSQCRTTLYVAREWTRHIVGPLHVGALGVVGTGYNSFVMPAVLPEVVFRFDRVEAALLVQPVVSPAFIAGQLRFRF